MRHQRGVRLFGVVVVGLCGIVSPATLAQSEPVGQVTASGAAVVSRQPDVLRMTVEVRAEGKDIKDAVTQLGAAREAARAKLKTLGADEKSVTFGDPSVGSGGALDPLQRQMQMMQRMMNRGGGTAAKPATGPASVTVSAPLTAEFPLKAADADQLLVTGTELREKLEREFAPPGAANPGADGLSPEEQEVLEEMAMDEDEDAAKPGAPTFTFVCRLTDEDQTQAAAEAFGRARDDAARLAKAVGRDLGPVRELKSVAGGASGSSGEDDYSTAMYAAFYGNAAGLTSPSDPAAPAEASGPGPTSVKYHVNVSATFGLK